MQQNHSVLLGVSYISLPKIEWKDLKTGKNHKNELLTFSQKCHKSEILGKKYVNLLQLYSNRRFMGGFYSVFSLKLNRFGWRQNAWIFTNNRVSRKINGARTFLTPYNNGARTFLDP